MSAENIQSIVRLYRAMNDRDPEAITDVVHPAAEWVPDARVGEGPVRIPPGTQSGSVLRLKGRGLPRLGQSGYGDLHVRVHVWTPERLTDEQERLFRELARHEGAAPQQTSGFWSRIREVLGA